MESTRTCTRCGEDLPVERFSGGQRRCNPCRVAHNRERVQAGEIKHCAGCHSLRPIHHFTTREKNARCAKCRGKKPPVRSKYTVPGGEVQTNRRRLRTCTGCKQEKPPIEFRVYDNRSYSTQCIACLEAPPEVRECGHCHRMLTKSAFGRGRWNFRNKSGIRFCLECKPPRELYHKKQKHIDYDYAFARDVLGWSHESTLEWLIRGWKASEDVIRHRYGPPEAPRKYKPYEPDPIKELERVVITYKNLAGEQTQGTVWCEGPKDKTVWVIRPDGSCAVVNPTKRVEVEYEQPEYLTPVPEEALDLAYRVMEQYSTAQNDLGQLGYTQPIGQDFVIASALIRHAEEFNKARRPFLDCHALPSVNEFDKKGEHKQTAATVRSSVGIKRMRELTKEDIEQ